MCEIDCAPWEFCVEAELNRILDIPFATTTASTWTSLKSGATVRPDKSGLLQGRPRILYHHIHKVLGGSTSRTISFVITSIDNFHVCEEHDGAGTNRFPTSITTTSSTASSLICASSSISKNRVRQRLLQQLPMTVAVTVSIYGQSHRHLYSP